MDQQVLDVQLSALRHVLSPYPGAYTGLMVGALLLISWLANWVTKRILLRVLHRILSTVWRNDEDKPLHLSVIPVAILDHHNAGRSTADALAMLSRSEEAMIAAWSRGDLRAPPAPEAAARLRENGAAAASIGLRGTPTLVWRRADGTEGRTDGLPNNLEALVATAAGG